MMMINNLIYCKLICRKLTYPYNVRTFSSKKVNTNVKVNVIEPNKINDIDLNKAKTLTINLKNRDYKKYCLRGEVRDPSIVLVLKIGKTVGFGKYSVELVNVLSRGFIEDRAWKSRLFTTISSILTILILVISGFFYYSNKMDDVSSELGELDSLKSIECDENSIKNSIDTMEKYSEDLDLEYLEDLEFDVPATVDYSTIHDEDDIKIDDYSIIDDDDDYIKVDDNNNIIVDDNNIIDDDNKMTQEVHNSANYSDNQGLEYYDSFNTSVMQDGTSLMFTDIIIDLELINNLKNLAIESTVDNLEIVTKRVNLTLDIDMVKGLYNSEDYESESSIEVPNTGIVKKYRDNQLRSIIDSLLNGGEVTIISPESPSPGISPEIPSPGITTLDATVSRIELEELKRIQSEKSSGLEVEQPERMQSKIPFGTNINTNANTNTLESNPKPLDL